MSVLKTDTRAIGNFSAERQGYEFTVDFILSEVTGATAIAQMYNALTDFQIPAIGSDLSAVDLDLTGCWLRAINAEVMSPGTVKLILHYSHSPIEQLVIEAGSTLNQVQTNKDKNDAKISLEYTYPDPFPPNPQFAGTTATQGGTFTKMVPERVLVYKQRESTSPQSFAALYEGKVNDATWQGGAAGTWIVASITGRSDNSGIDFVNFYRFQYRKDGWDPEVVFIDPSTGKPPPDVGAGGQKVVATYDNFNFTDLFPA